MNKTIIIVTLIAILYSLMTYAALNTSVVSCWSFKTNLTDLAYGGNNLSLMGSPIWSNTSCFFPNEGCIDLSSAGAGHYLRNVTRLRNLPNLTESRTIACWWKPPAVVGASFYAYGYGYQSANNGFQIAGSPTNYTVWTHSAEQTTGVIPTPNAWTLITMNSSSTSISFRYNNTEGYTGSFPNLSTTVRTGLFIGSSLTGASTSGGVFDDCYIFNTSLTPSDFSDLWNGGTGVTCNDIVSPSAVSNSLSVNWNIYTPTNNTLINNGNETVNFNFNYTGTNSTNATCRFYYNGTNTDTLIGVVNNTIYNFSVSKYPYYVLNSTSYIECNATNLMWANSSIKTLRWNLTIYNTFTWTNYPLLNSSYTLVTTPQFFWNTTTIGGNWNYTLYDNLSVVGTKTIVNTTGYYNITSSTLIANREHLIQLIAIDNTNTSNILTMENKSIYITGTSCNATTPSFQTCAFSGTSIALNTITGCS